MFLGSSPNRVLTPSGSSAFSHPRPTSSSSTASRASPVRMSPADVSRRLHQRPGSGSSFSGATPIPIGGAAGYRNRAATNSGGTATPVVGSGRGSPPGPQGAYQTLMSGVGGTPQGATSTSATTPTPSPPVVKEWSFFGTDIPICSLRELDPSSGMSEEASISPPVDRAPISSMDATSELFGTPPSSSDAEQASSTAQPQQQRQQQQDIFSASFAGDRWRLELLGAPGAPTFSLYIMCQLLDSYPASEFIPTTLFVGIREPGEQVGKREARDGWVWSTWEPEWAFSSDNEYWECHTFPSFNHLLATNQKVASLDSLILSIQIQSPIQGTVGLAPHIGGKHYVPRDLLLGIERLLDDESTADVIIWVWEHMPGRVARYESAEVERADSESGKPSPGTNDEPKVMKRCLYAHSAILTARASYFESMFSAFSAVGGGWAESTKLETGERRNKRFVLKIDDFDFQTVYWLLRWLYTNEIDFSSSEEVRSSTDGVAAQANITLGMDSSTASSLASRWPADPESVPWDWIPVSQISSFATSSGCDQRPDHHRKRLEHISEDDDEVSTVCCSSTTGSIISGISSGVTPPATRIRRPGTLPPKRRSDVQSSSEDSLSNETMGTPTTSPSARRSGSIPAYSTSSPPPAPASAAGRISPLGGRISPQATRSAAVSGKKGVHDGKIASESDSVGKEPHKHPTKLDSPASALATYKLAHRYGLDTLAELALRHIVTTLTPRTAFPLLLSSFLWKDLYQAIKCYALANYWAIVTEPEFARCYAEVGDGLWVHGGEVLLDFTLQLSPAIAPVLDGGYWRE